MGLRAMWFSAVAVVLGAIIWRILTEQILGIDLDIVAMVLMIAGAAGLGVSVATYTFSFYRGSREMSGSRLRVVATVVGSGFKFEPAIDVTGPFLGGSAGGPEEGKGDQGDNSAPLHLTSS